MHGHVLSHACALIAESLTHGCTCNLKKAKTQIFPKYHFFLIVHTDLSPLIHFYRHRHKNSKQTNKNQNRRQQVKLSANDSYFFFYRLCIRSRPVIPERGVCLTQFSDVCVGKKKGSKIVPMITFCWQDRPREKSNQFQLLLKSNSTSTDVIHILTDSIFFDLSLADWTDRLTQEFGTKVSTKYGGCRELWTCRLSAGKPVVL